MNDEVSELLERIRKRANGISSYVARIQSTVNFGPFPVVATGDVYFKRPDRFKSIGTFNDRKFIALRIGTKVERYFPETKELWRFDIDLMPKVEPVSSSLADLTNPLLTAGEGDLSYGGTTTEGGRHFYLFSVNARAPTEAKLIDARSGQVMTFLPKALETSTRVLIDSESCLLAKLIMLGGNGQALCSSEYSPTAINIEIDESVFQMPEPESEMRILDFATMMHLSVNPNAMDNASSVN